MYSWLNEVFTPYLEQKKSEEDEKCLLIMEKDYGTTNTRFQNSCELNGVVPLYLPPCCPHLLPQLIFKRFQERYHQNINQNYKIR